jgi:hypothetical protein
MSTQQAHLFQQVDFRAQLRGVGARLQVQLCNGVALLRVLGALPAGWAWDPCEREVSSHIPPIVLAAALLWVLGTLPAGQPSMLW